MRRLIVNADDLGRSGGINAGIFEATRRGLVRSASLMVSHPAAEEAASALPPPAELGVGLHLALTGGVPVLPPERVPSLIDAEGRLPPRPAGLSRVRPAEVRAEMRAQLQRFRELTGRQPTHLDSHHHCHRLKPLFEELAALAREEGLPVRCASTWMRARLDRLGVARTDAFVEGFYGEGANLETLLRILGRLGPGTTELMCHPARLDEELRRTSSYAEERARELEALTHPRALALARQRRLHLIHFGQL